MEGASGSRVELRGGGGAASIEGSGGSVAVRVSNETVLFGSECDAASLSMAVVRF